MLLFVAWVDLEDIILSEITQVQKSKYHMISFICGICRSREKKGGYQELGMECGQLGR